VRAVLPVLPAVVVICHDLGHNDCFAKSCRQHVAARKTHQRL
jgi:hypothetical protein